MTPYIATGGVAAVLTLAAGGPLVRWLRRMGAVKSIREEAPSRHGKKAGTPTMGGVLIIGAALFAVLIAGGATGGISRPTLVALAVVIGFSAVGGVDDVLGIVHHRNLGLRARERLLLQIPMALALGVYAVLHPAVGTWIGVPGTQVKVDLGWGYPVFCALYVVGMANAVNLTDGLDGLAAGSVVIAAGALAAIAAQANVAQANVAPAGMLCAALAGAALGFLWYNAHPAQVFMGDIGSQGLGAALAVAGVLAKMELLVVVVGGLFVWEALSVMLQVASFKTTGRRIFRMSPFHHHLELIGWTETQTVVRFWVCGALLAALGVRLKG